MTTSSVEFDIKNLLHSKFATDSLANISSIMILIVCGLLLNLLIARYYGPRALGIFNLVYAVLIFVSQFASLGIQVSSLKHIAEFSENRGTCSAIILSGLLIVFITATFFSVLLYFLRYWISSILHAPDLATAILYVIPGLWCFTLNKLLLNILNGFRKMKSYAFFVSFRYLAVITVLSIAIIIKVPGPKLSSIFSISEFLLLVALFLYIMKFISVTNIAHIKKWIKKHFFFGIKSLVGGITVGLMTRVDILILGYFTSEWHVGIYSFAATIVEGVMQIPVVLKQNVDPVLTKLIIQRKHDDIVTIVKKGRKWTFYGTTLISALVILAFPIVVRLLIGNHDFLAGWPLLVILLAGAIVEASYLPFSGILVQGGYPGTQTMLLLFVIVSNIIMSVCFVSLFGITGAAVATSLSFILFTLYLKGLTFRALKIRI